MTHDDALADGLERYEQTCTGGGWKLLELRDGRYSPARYDIGDIMAIKALMNERHPLLPSRTENVEGHEHTGWGPDGMNDCEGCADEYWAKVASRTENVDTPEVSS